MKIILTNLAFALVILSLYQCSTPSHTVGKSTDTRVKDVIEPKVIAASFQKELAGTWNVISMRRQQKAELETLSGVTLMFNESDLRFSGKAPCNSITGSIMLKGYSIRFQNVAATKMACDKLEQEDDYLKLLNERISAFTIDKDKLYLRDGISNVVFECDRVK